eukprot:5593888-Amphidinium_carterae.1
MEKTCIKIQFLHLLAAPLNSAAKVVECRRPKGNCLGPACPSAQAPAATVDTWHPDHTPQSKTMRGPFGAVGLVGSLH